MSRAYCSLQYKFCSPKCILSKALALFDLEHFTNSLFVIQYIDGVIFNGVIVTLNAKAIIYNQLSFSN